MPSPPAHLPEVTVWSLSTSELAAAITPTLARLSPGRANMVTDQLHGILRSQSADRLITLAVGPTVDTSGEPAAPDAKPPLGDCLLAIAVLPESGDTGTILHMDWVDPAAAGQKIMPAERRGSGTVDETLCEHFAESLWQEVETRLRRGNVRFVQWATDPESDSEPDAGAITLEAKTAPISRWPSLLAFSRIGTLDYLALDADADGNWSGSGESAGGSACRLYLHPLDHNAADQVQRFEQLVQKTYAESLDCPTLEKFRSVTEILAGYRAVDAFSPRLWFTVSLTASSPVEFEAVGCLILSLHPGPANDGTDRVNPAAVVELVYMGISPEHRGHGYGGQVMRLIAEVCQQQGAQRLILAVDRENRPAVDAYCGFGMKPLFRESVWGRSVSAGKVSAGE